MANALDHFVHRLRFLLDPLRNEGITDGQLLHRWATNRDSRAFAVLVGRHGALVWRVSKSVVRQAEEAEDVFQATFFVLARKAASLRKHSSVAGWLYQTAYKLALKARTARVRRLHYEEQVTPRTIPNPLEEISVREAGSILAQELDRLSAIYREPLLLCLYEGATQDEAARQLGCSLNTLKSRLERGRALLAQRLSRRGLAPASALAFTLYAASHAPAQLIHKTITGATHFACGEAVTGTAALLANGALQTVLLKKSSIYLALVLAMGSLSVAAGFAFVQGKPLTEQVAQEQPKPIEDEKLKPRVDALGDPLPPGAVNRIGSSRFRHNGRVHRVLYTPDGKSLVSISWDLPSQGSGYLYRWDAATGKLSWNLGMNKITHQSELVMSGDGKKLAVLSDFEYAVVTTDTGKIVARNEFVRAADDDTVRSLAISSDLGSVARGCNDATVRLYDAVTGQEKMRIVVGDKAQRQFPLAIEFGADGKTIYVAVAHKPGILVYDAKTGKAAPWLELSKPLTNPCYLVQSKKGNLLASIDLTRVVLWDLKAGKQRYLIANDLPGYYGAFSPDEGLFALGGVKEILLFDTTTGKKILQMPSHPGKSSLAFAPGGTTLAAGDFNGCITLWDVATGERMPPSPEPSSLRNLRFANKGKQLVLFGDGGEWWDLISAKILRCFLLDQKTYPKSFDGNMAQSVSPDGTMLAAVSALDELVLIDVATGKNHRTLMRKAHYEGMSEFSPDGTKLFWAGGIDPQVIIWDITTGEQLHELKSHTRCVNRLAVSPDGRWLASAATSEGDYDIRLWDIATGRLVHRLMPRRGSAFSIVFSADSSRLVSVGGEPGRMNIYGEVQLWNVVTGKETCAFNGHKERVKCAAISGDGRMLATGSMDKTLRLWEVASGKERGQITGHESCVFSLDFSPDGRLLAAASRDAPVFIWDAYFPKTSNPPGTKLAKEDREKLWQNLADLDATIAFQAICELIARPNEAVTLLQGEWTRLPRTKQMRKWVEDLNSDQFALRKAATVAIERFAAGHEDMLRESLKNAPSLEVQQRLERILGRLDPQRLRNSRMLEVLEQIRNDHARQFLRALAEQKEDTAMAREAAAGLKRVEQQK